MFFKRRTWLIFNKVILDVLYIEKFAILLPKCWLAETPETLALMRLGRQGVDF
jgi:hypothetical protein